ncbi:MAG: TPM domain-containing protein [Nanoarchaeota archaeon]
MKKGLLLLVLGFLIFSFVASAQIPKIDSYVTDNAGVLSESAKAQLLNEIVDLEKSTKGVQFAIYIEKEYSKDYSLEEYTLKIAEDNKIGKKGNDNGILLYVATEDRVFRWEVGYGVESTLSASLLGRISRDYLIPSLKENNYEKGILDTFDVAKRILLGSNDADIVRLKEEKSGTGSYFLLIFFGLFLLIIVMSILQRKANAHSSINKRNDSYYKGAASGIFLGNLGRGRGGFGGGGFGGGGFGGFSGGGGGFGGGGFGGKF